MDKIINFYINSWDKNDERLNYIAIIFLEIINSLMKFFTQYYIFNYLISNLPENQEF